MNSVSGMAAAVSLLRRGLWILSACCLSYILFWFNGYQPEKAFRRSQPLSIFLFLLTFALGACGLYFILNGMNGFEPKHTPVCGTAIVISAIVLYLLMAWITIHFFQRPVTTELLLITLWTALMVQILNVSVSQNLLTHTETVISIVLLILVYLICMVLYVAYYRMSPWPAYWFAAMPLLAIGIDCAITACML